MITGADQFERGGALGKQRKVGRKDECTSTVVIADWWVLCSSANNLPFGPCPQRRVDAFAPAQSEYALLGR